jgi:hypothetical protein
MLEWFAALETEPGDAEIADFGHPPLQIGDRGMRNRVIELVAIMAIEVALLGHIEMCGPRLGVEDTSDGPKNRHDE